jgi:hypothetical protein
MRLSELILSAIQFVNQGKYFRITFGRKFLWMEHISNTANETLARNSELPLLGYHSNLSKYT